MKLSEFINKDSIFLDVHAESQKNVFKILGNIFSKKNIYSSSKNSSFLNTEITGISKGIISNSKVHIVE